MMVDNNKKGIERIVNESYGYNTETVYLSEDILFY